MYQTQNYGYQQQPYQVSRPTYPNNAVAYPGIKGRPVASLEEARASMIDFDGSVFYFPDLANRRIYTKQINMDGTATMNVYELREMPIEEKQIAPKDFVTRDEFNLAITQLREALTQMPRGQVSPVEEPAAAPAKPSIALNF